MNAIVLGLGNAIRTDDGVGIHAIRKLIGDHPLPPDVHTIEGGTLGLELLPRIKGVSHLLALDAVDAGAAPGTLIRYAGGDLANLPTGKSLHLLGFTDLVGTLSLLDATPREVILLGVQPKSTDWGTGLSAEVEARLGGLVEAAWEQLSNWLQTERRGPKTH
jgi:hydrogenase maturation protease